MIPPKPSAATGRGVDRLMPAVLTRSGSSTRRPSVSRPSTRVIRMVSSAGGEKAYCDSGPSWDLAPERISWSSRCPLAVPTAVRASTTIAAVHSAEVSRATPTPTQTLRPKYQLDIEADALAIAICHASHRSSAQMLAARRVRETA